MFCSGFERSIRLGDNHDRLWTALCSATAGGKRFRPRLVVAAHDALDGHARPSAFRAGAALELLHTAFVIHDDVIDGEDTRRGRLNVSGSFAAHARSRGAEEAAARHQGTAAGILAGDLALLSAMTLVARCGAGAEVVDQLIELVEEAVHATVTGELTDVRTGLSAESASIDEALRVAELKTGAYSFQLPLQAGAILAEAPAEVTAALGHVGRFVGIGFQLLDDLLGVFGDETRTGKSATSDLREGKITCLIAAARPTSVWPELQALIGLSDLSDHEAARARDLLEECGARAVVQTLADRHLDAALTGAERSALPDPVLEVISDLIDELRDNAALGMLAPAAARASSETVLR